MSSNAFIITDETGDDLDVRVRKDKIRLGIDVQGYAAQVDLTAATAKALIAHLNNLLESGDVK